MYLYDKQLFEKEKLILHNVSYYINNTLFEFEESLSISAIFFC